MLGLMRHWPLPLILLVTGLIYTTSFPAAFHYDDRALMLEHPQVRGDFRYTSFIDQYGGRPLTLWTFHWNYRLAGAEPLTYHLVSILLHLVAVALAYALALRFGATLVTASASALLFGIHPLQTQAVNYIWSRSMLLMAVFALSSLLLARRRPWLSLAVFQLAIWSRTGALVLALPLMLLEPRMRKRTLLLGGVNGIAFLTGLAVHAPREVGWNHADPLSYWLTQPVALWNYLRLMVWPSGLHVDYSLPFQPLAWLAGAAVLLLSGWLVWASWPPKSPLTWGVMLLILWLLPSMALPNSDLFNESRSYLALFGFALALMQGLGWLGEKLERSWMGPLLAAILLVVLVPQTMARNAVWTDDVRLWRDAASKSPEKARVRYNLGSALALIGENDEAAREFQRAVELDPGDDMAHAGLGYCAEMRGDWAQAEDYYRRALEINPLNAYANEGLMRVKRD